MATREPNQASVRSGSVHLPQAIIRDRSGAEYSLAVEDETETHYHVVVMRPGEFIGEAKCLIDPAGVMELADIVIRKEVVPSRPCLLRLLPWFLRKRLTAHHYRGRGLGSALL